MIPVAHYRIMYSPQANNGKIDIQLADGQTLNVPVNSATEYIAVALILEAGNARFDPANGVLFTQR
jgi:hypothetical protein